MTEIFFNGRVEDFHLFYYAMSDLEVINRLEFTQLDNDWKEERLIVYP